MELAKYPAVSLLARTLPGGVLLLPDAKGNMPPKRACSSSGFCGVDSWSSSNDMLNTPSLGVRWWRGLRGGVDCWAPVEEKENGNPEGPESGAVRGPLSNDGRCSVGVDGGVRSSVVSSQMGKSSQGKLGTLLVEAAVLMALPVDAGRLRMGICDDEGSEREILPAWPCALARECV
jgi:hypothetical protein